MQKANGRVPKHASIACGRTISGLFHSPCGVLFAFPSRYLFTIGHHGVVSLGGWSPRIQTEFHVFRPTWDACRVHRVFGYGAITPSGRTFQSVRLTFKIPCPGPATPEGKPSGLGLRRFRSPLLAPSRFDFSSSGY